MAISLEDYPTLQAWLKRVIELTTPQSAHLLVLADRPTARNRAGLEMAINDMMEMTAAWTPERVAALDVQLAADRLPTLSSLRVRFFRTVRRAVARGCIRDEVEYYAVVNAVDAAFPDEQEVLSALIGEFEARLRRKSSPDASGA